MNEIDNNIIFARKKYFDEIKHKNAIDHSRIDELDIENIGMSLTYQQVDLIKIAFTSNKPLYKHYQELLLTQKSITKKNRYILLLKELSQDKEIPERIREVIIKIYEQSKNDENINELIIDDIIEKLMSKLSTDLQELIYRKLKNTCCLEELNCKSISMEDILKFASYIEDNYTFVTFKSVCEYKNYVNSNGSFYKENLKRMLEFAYENGKQVRITSLINSDSFPPYLTKLPKEMIKQRLVNYIDDLTRYIKAYNSTHKRLDRKKVIIQLDVFNNLIMDDETIKYKDYGWQKYLTFNDLCDAIKVARKNLPEINFCYNETNLNNKNKRKMVSKLIAKIKEYEQVNNTRLIDTIGINLNIDLDMQKDDIIEMLKDLNSLNLNISISDFNLNPTEFMISNNTKEEIETLRDRFITDFCNIVVELNSENKINIDTININNACDLSKNEYGIYDMNMNKKEERYKIRKIKEVKNEKSFTEIMCFVVIIITLVIIIMGICYLFKRYI